ncbi:MAG: HD domain-containing protein [bacterium]|nr:HD domain-containing protein [bacterium]
MDLLDKLFVEMIHYYEGDPMRLQHFIKVHSFARLIGIEEDLPLRELFILESAAYVHDIGIKEAEKKFGKSNGKLQEQEGPQLAEKMLSQLGFDKTVIERVSYLVGHHHTYTNVDGADYRILLEADFLVNLYEENPGHDAIRYAYENIFKTNTGKMICREMFSRAFKNFD